MSTFATLLEVICALMSPRLTDMQYSIMNWTVCRAAESANSVLRQLIHISKPKQSHCYTSSNDESSPTTRHTVATASTLYPNSSGSSCMQAGSSTPKMVTMTWSHHTHQHLCDSSDVQPTCHLHAMQPACNLLFRGRRCINLCSPTQ